MNATSTKYEWRKGFPDPGVAPDVFAEEVDRIAQRTGYARPEMILDAAKNPKSPLHPAFQWDDKSAADSWRRKQAADMLGALHVVRVRIDTGQVEAERAFYCVRPHERAPERGYMPSDVVMGSRELRIQVLKDARRAIETDILRFQNVLSQGPYIAGLKGILDQMKDEIDALETASRRRVAERGSSFSTGTSDAHLGAGT